MYLLNKVLFFVCAGGCLTPWISPPLALMLGILLALTIDNPFDGLSRSIAKYLLQGSVVMLGFGMDLAIVLRAGANGILFVLASIVATFVIGHFLGQLLQISLKASTLISSGTAICGGSAIAAVSSVINAAASEISVAMGTVFVLNAFALFVFPPLGQALNLTQTQFGTWAGVAIHDISSVVGAASSYGQAALQTATAVKLSRTLWIVPISLIAGYLFQHQQIADDQKAFIKPSVPWFIGMFLLASVTRTVVPTAASWSSVLTPLSEAGFTLTLFLIGTGLSRQMLIAVGWKPMLQGLLLWIFISLTSLRFILWVVP